VNAALATLLAVLAGSPEPRTKPCALPVAQSPSFHCVEVGEADYRFLGRRYVDLASLMAAWRPQLRPGLMIAMSCASSDQRHRALLEAIEALPDQPGILYLNARTGELSGWKLSCQQQSFDVPMWRLA
jgi:hypothetical protein